MTDLLERKLSRFVSLSMDDCHALRRLGRDTRRLRKGEDLIREGQNPNELYLICEGWGFRYRHTLDGKRQIFSYLIPGDSCDIRLWVLEEIDHTISLLSDSIVAYISYDDLGALFANHPRIERAMLLSALVDEGIMREWLTSAGQRRADESIAHLFYEIWLRRCAVGHRELTFALPLTQQELGDTVGLTPVHVNRVLQRLRDEGVISFARKELTIHDREKLAKIGTFEDNYLRLKPT